MKTEKARKNGKLKIIAVSTANTLWATGTSAWSGAALSGQALLVVISACGTNTIYRVSRNQMHDNLRIITQNKMGTESRRYG